MLRLPHLLVRPLVIAHRGASGHLPELTIEAFNLAVAQGADAIELDIVPTRDGVLVARHENELSATTNIASLSAFSDRRTRRTLEGVALDGWFIEDFTAAEIQSLRARQRFTFRDRRFDGQFSIPMLDDVLHWQSHLSRPIQLLIEIKHPTHFQQIGLPVDQMLLQALSEHNLMRRDSGIVLMSFETRILQNLRSKSDLPLIQLLDATDARPYDWTAAGDPRTNADLIAPAGLADIASYADSIGPWKRLIVPTLLPDADGVAADAQHLAPATSLITEAHAKDLFVCAWTFRDEPQFLPAEYAGNPLLEYAHFARLGLDGFTTDFPSTARQAETNKT